MTLQLTAPSSISLEPQMKELSGQRHAGTRKHDPWFPKCIKEFSRRLFPFYQKSLTRAEARRRFLLLQKEISWELRIGVVYSHLLAWYTSLLASALFVHLLRDYVQKQE